MDHKEVNCVPILWIGLPNISSHFPQCSRTSQYKKIAELTSDFTSFEAVRKEYDPPCEEMSIVTNVQRVKGRKDQIKFMKEP